MRAARAVIEGWADSTRSLLEELGFPAPAEGGGLRCSGLCCD